MSYSCCDSLRSSQLSGMMACPCAVRIPASSPGGDPPPSGGSAVLGADGSSWRSAFLVVFDGDNGAPTTMVLVAEPSDGGKGRVLSRCGGDLRFLEAEEWPGDPPKAEGGGSDGDDDTGGEEGGDDKALKAFQLRWHGAGSPRLFDAGVLSFHFETPEARDRCMAAVEGKLSEARARAGEAFAERLKEEVVT